MKSRFLLILSIILLVTSLPFVMGADEKEPGSTLSKEELKTASEKYFELYKLAVKKTGENSTELAKIKNEMDSLKNKVLTERNPYYNDSKLDLGNQITQTQTEFEFYSTAIAEAGYKRDTLSDTKGLLYFESGDAVQAWVDLFSQAAGTPQTTTEKINWARKMQAAGLSDGYIINVNFFHNQGTGQYDVCCTTVIDGRFYSWKAGTEIATQDTGHDVRVFRQFSSPWSLKSWLEANTVSDDFTSAAGDDWVKAARQICIDAAAKGYDISYSTKMVNGVITVVECRVNINGQIYYFDPRNDELYDTSKVE